MHYVTFYNAIRQWFLQGPGGRMKTLKLLYRTIPLLIAASYIGCGFFVLLREHNLKLLCCYLVIPASFFAAASIFRKCFNRPRPYEDRQTADGRESRIVPLIPKNKSGASFPSRHTLSAALIATACMFVSVPIGICCVILTTILGITRVLAGVHYPSDVICAMGIGYLSCVCYFLGL